MGYGAAVEYEYVGPCVGSDQVEPSLSELEGQGFCLRLVELATEMCDSDGLHGALDLRWPSLGYGSER